MPQFSDDLFLGPAITYMGTNPTATEAVFAGSVSGTTLTITAQLSGDPIVLGQYIGGTGVTAGSYVTAFVSGSGGAGTYTLSASSSATGAINIFSSGNAYLADPSPMSLGVGPLGRVYVWDIIPQALSAANIAAAQTTSSTIALTAGTSVKSITNFAGQTVLQLDCARAVSITSGTGTLTNRNVTITGYDYYGQPMSEVIATGTTQSTTVNGKKAFYQILSASISGALGATIQIGTTDILGLPVRVVDAGYLVGLGWANASTRATVTFVQADTAAATTTTGDVRGTVVPSSSTDGIKRLVVTVGCNAIMCGPNATRQGALGVNQNLVS
jgi:hypothetical protein